MQRHLLFHRACLQRPQLQSQGYLRLAASGVCNPSKPAFQANGILGGMEGAVHSGVIQWSPGPA